MRSSVLLPPQSKLGVQPDSFKRAILSRLKSLHRQAGSILPVNLALGCHMESTTPQEMLIEVDARFKLAIVGLLALGTAVVFAGVSIWISIVMLFFVLVLLSRYSRSRYSVVYFPTENRICRVTSNGDTKCIVVENGGIITLTTLNRYWLYVVSATNNNHEMDLVVTGKYQQAKYVAERLSALTGARCKLDKPIFFY